MPRAESGSWKIPAAYAAVYVAWGSTYFAIKIGVAHFSPAGMCGVRFALAAALMFGAWRWFSGGRAAPTARECLSAAGIGAVLLGGGTGGLAYAERVVPSGVCALVIGCSPMLFALFNRLAGGPALSGRQIAGGLLGTTGAVLLALDGGGAKDAGFPLAGLGVLVFGMVCWTGSSVASKYVPLPKDNLLTAAVQNLTASILLLALGLARGEFRPADLSTLRPDTWAAIVYLAVVGSGLGFTAYTWLLAHEPANRVSSYAFVNPVVAVALGTALGGEPLTKTMGAAICLILGGVALSMLGARGKEAAEPPPRAGIEPA